MQVPDLIQSHDSHIRVLFLLEERLVYVLGGSKKFFSAEIKLLSDGWAWNGNHLLFGLSGV